MVTGWLLFNLLDVFVVVAAFAPLIWFAHIRETEWRRTLLQEPRVQPSRRERLKVWSIGIALFIWMIAAMGTWRPSRAAIEAILERRGML